MPRDPEEHLMSNMIPIVASADELDSAIRFATMKPTARWYVAERARVLGRPEVIPEDWNMPVVAASGEMTRTPDLTPEEDEKVKKAVADGTEGKLPEDVRDPDHDGDDDLVAADDTDHDGAAYRKKLGLTADAEVPEIVRVDSLDGIETVTASVDYEDFGDDGGALVATAFTDEQRSKLADSGAAMPDGSFPIRNRTDLQHALRAVGRAKNSAAAKRHIKKRAKKLGLADALPDDYKAITASADEVVSDFKDALRSRVEPVVAAAHEDERSALRDRVSEDPIVATSLSDHLKKIGKDFDEALHPRGKDGEFITVGGRVSVDTGDGKKLEGVVKSIDKEGIHVLPDGSHSTTFTFKPSQITNAPTAEAHIGTPEAQAPIRLTGHQSINLRTGKVTDPDAPKTANETQKASHAADLASTQAKSENTIPAHIAAGDAHIHAATVAQSAGDTRGAAVHQKAATSHYDAAKDVNTANDKAALKAMQRDRVDANEKSTDAFRATQKANSSNGVAADHAAAADAHRQAAEASDKVPGMGVHAESHRQSAAEHEAAASAAAGSEAKPKEGADAKALLDEGVEGHYEGTADRDTEGVIGNHQSLADDFKKAANHPDTTPEQRQKLGDMLHDVTNREEDSFGYADLEEDGHSAKEAKRLTKEHAATMQRSHAIADEIKGGAPKTESDYTDKMKAARDASFAAHSDGGPSTPEAHKAAADAHRAAAASAGDKKLEAFHNDTAAMHERIAAQPGMEKGWKAGVKEKLRDRVAPSGTTPRLNIEAEQTEHEKALHGIAQSFQNKGIGLGTDQHARIDAILKNADKDDAHKQLASLMSEAKLGGKQRARYREALNAHHASQDGGKITGQLSTGSNRPASSLREDNELKSRLAAKEAGSAGRDIHDEAGKEADRLNSLNNPKADDLADTIKQEIQGGSPESRLAHLTARGQRQFPARNSADTNPFTGPKLKTADEIKAANDAKHAAATAKVEAKKANPNTGVANRANAYTPTQRELADPAHRAKSQGLGANNSDRVEIDHKGVTHTFDRVPDTSTSNAGEWHGAYRSAWGNTENSHIGKVTDPALLDRLNGAHDAEVAKRAAPKVQDARNQTGAQQIDHAVQMFGSDRSKWSLTNLRIAAAAGDGLAVTELEKRSGKAPGR